MAEQKNTVKLELMDIQIGITILISLFLCHGANALGIPLEGMVVSTGALMCVQDSAKAAYTTSLTRMLGVFVGGLLGVMIALIDNAVDLPWVFYLMCSVGVVVNLLVCKYFKMIYVQARVSALTLLLTVMVYGGMDRLDYALNRFVGSLVGALIAVVMTMIFSAIVKRTKKEN